MHYIRRATLTSYFALLTCFLCHMCYQGKIKIILEQVFVEVQRAHLFHVFSLKKFQRFAFDNLVNLLRLSHNYTSVFDFPQKNSPPKQHLV